MVATARCLLAAANAAGDHNAAAEARAALLLVGENPDAPRERRRLLVGGQAFHARNAARNAARGALPLLLALPLLSGCATATPATQPAPTTHATEHPTPPASVLPHVGGDQSNASGWDEAWWFWDNDNGPVAETRAYVAQTHENVAWVRDFPADRDPEKEVGDNGPDVAFLDEAAGVWHVFRVSQD